MSQGQKRRDQILRLISREGFETVQALARERRVSDMTIRRDLDELERQGSIRRTHGGAVSEHFTQIELDFRFRQKEQPDVKRRLAGAAAALVEDGETIFLDAGTTIAAMVPFLLDRRGLTVVTHSLPVARDLAGRPGICTILLGGQIRHSLFATVGHIAEDTLRMFKLDKAFLGTAGVDLGRGLSHSSEEEIPLKKLAARLAHRVIVVADRSKLAKGRVLFFMPWTDIDLFVTDGDRGLGFYAGRSRKGARKLGALPHWPAASVPMRRRSQTTASR